jgi:hypothetical protein
MNWIKIFIYMQNNIDTNTSVYYYCLYITPFWIFYHTTHGRGVLLSRKLKLQTDSAQSIGELGTYLKRHFSSGGILKINLYIYSNTIGVL